jgi:hypothetical protein
MGRLWRRICVAVSLISLALVGCRLAVSSLSAAGSVGELVDEARREPSGPQPPAPATYPVPFLKACKARSGPQAPAPATYPVPFLKACKAGKLCSQFVPPPCTGGRVGAIAGPACPTHLHSLAYPTF